MPPTTSTGAVRWSLAAVRALVEGVVDGVLVVDAEGTVLLHNKAAASLFGVRAGAMVGERLTGPRWKVLDPEGQPLRGQDHPLTAALADGQASMHRSMRIEREGGPSRWVHLRVRPLGEVDRVGEAAAVFLERASDPRITRSLHSFSLDLRDPVDVDALDVLFGQDVVGMVEVSGSRGTVVRANEAFLSLVGRPAEEVLGEAMRGFVSHEDAEAHRLGVRRVADGGAEHHSFEVKLLRADGVSRPVRVGLSALRDAEGRCRSLIFQVVDLTRQRRAERFMSTRLMQDPLTQLHGRTLLIDMLGDALQTGRSMAVIALNLDRFKAVNDSLGQQVGDGVLVEVADRLRVVLQPGDSAARFSGDDFVLLCSGVRTRTQADALTQRVLDAVAEPIEVAGLRIQLTASAGVALTGGRAGMTADEVLTQATQALRHAKERGRARWKVYDRQMRSASTDRLRIETSLRTAVDEGRLRVAYQPLLDLAGRGTVGAEALLRWDDPVIGAIAPPVFLPVAEESGLIVPLGEFVLREALGATARWRELTGADLYVSVNLSPNELNRPGITSRVAEVLASVELPSDALRLEITESVLVDADDQVRRNLADLVQLGVAVGIDDFGTGYASMSYLKTLPLDFVKIDQSFVAGLTTSREDHAIVKATLELAHTLGLVSIAEGIERPEQLDVLRDMGCDVAQGYLIGRPDEPGRMLESFTR